jgi:hypothetical protein
MVANQPARQEITDFGQIKRIVGPPGWTASDQPQRGINSRTLKMFTPPDANDVSINLFFRGMPIAEKAAQDLAELLKHATASSQKLTPDQIKQMHAVFGLSTVGDNQYTNDAQKGSRNYPVFNMKSAELATLKGRPILRVRGNFQDENGNVTMEYNGIFIQPTTRPAEIEEVFYQAPDSAKFMKYAAAFDQTLFTIEWK